MSNVEHKVAVIAADAPDDLEQHLAQFERQGWELAATLPHSDGQVSLVFKRPRPLLGSPG